MMLVIMKRTATTKETAAVIKYIEGLGLRPHVSHGADKTIIGANGIDQLPDTQLLASLPSVESVVPVQKPYKLASREFQPDSSVVPVNGVRIGNGGVVVMAGPCAVESFDQTLVAARGAKAAGASVIRGGAFKPRTSPYSFQGLGEEGLKILARVREEVGLPIVSECLSEDDVELVSSYVDIIQIGARNMQNFAMLERVGKQSRPVLLKRGMMSTIEELLMSAEYILANGNKNVILCERGIRTFDKFSRNTCDIAAVPALKRLSHLPVIVDPSHATGDRYLISPVALAAVAAGADGLLIEVHPDPDKALCDGAQSLDLVEFAGLMNSVRAIAKAINETSGK
ncbi:MAG: 3-deoxy-7-phosphoheptulonate synthase [Candidatus Zixiibacteriota bacterium]